MTEKIFGLGNLPASDCSEQLGDDFVRGSRHVLFKLALVPLLDLLFGQGDLNVFFLLLFKGKHQAMIPSLSLLDGRVTINSQMPEKRISDLIRPHIYRNIHILISRLKTRFNKK